MTSWWLNDRNSRLSEKSAKVSNGLDTVGQIVFLEGLFETDCDRLQVISCKTSVRRKALGSD